MNHTSDIRIFPFLTKAAKAPQPKVARVTGQTRHFEFDRLRLKVSLRPQQRAQLKRVSGVREIKITDEDNRQRVDVFGAPPPSVQKIAAIIGDRQHVVTYAELAMNLVFASAAAKKEARHELDNHLVWLFSELDAKHPCDKNNTRYFQAKDEPARFVMYSDDKADQKVGGKPCVHIEVRMSRNALRENGISTIGDTLRVDHQAFWQAVFKGIDLDPAVCGRKYREEAKRRGWNESWKGFSDGYIGGRRIRIAEAWAYTEKRPFKLAPGQAVFTHMKKWPWLIPWRKGGVFSRADAEEPDHPQLSDALWEKIFPLVPKHHNRHFLGGGRPRKSDRPCMAAILFATRSGRLAAERRSRCHHSTALRREREWRRAGVFKRMYKAGLYEAPELHVVDWTKLGIKVGVNEPSHTRNTLL